MSVAAALGSIQQIQSRLTQLFGPDSALTQAAGAADGSGAPAGTDATSAAAFAQALSGAQPAQGPVAGSGGVTGADVVADAKKYLGVPYVFGGESTSGMDCSGLVQKVFGDLGVTMPRIVPDQAKMGTAVPSLAQAQPGDIIVLKGAHHIVIYAGDHKVIHAPSAGRNVQIANAWMTDDQIQTIRRIVPATPPPVVAAPGALAASGALGSLGSLGSNGSANATSLMAALQAAMATGGLS